MGQVVTRSHDIILDIGGTLPDVIAEKLFEAEIDTTMGAASAFTLRFYDADQSLIDDTRFALGTAVKISTDGADADQTETVILEGEITSIEPIFSADEDIVFVVRGYDKTHRMTRGTKHRVFKDVTHADIVSTIAGDYSLSANTDSTSPKYDHVFQDDISDRDFVEGLARLNGFRIDFKDGKLQFKKPTGDDTVELEWGMGPNDERQMRYFQPRMNLVGMVNKVVVSGWDPVTKAAITGEASSSTDQATIGDSAKGVSTASSKLGDSTYFAYIPDVKDPDAAGKIAQALLDTFNRSFIEAEGTIYGVPSLIAGKKLKITNLGTRFSGTYLVTSATHHYKDSEYHVYFRCEGGKATMLSDMILGAIGGSNGHSQGEQRGRWLGVVPAMVTNIKDEDNDIVRVKLKYPWMDDQLESHWARLVSVGVGAGKTGIHWLPQINDEVLVAFENGNFNRPYVLGGLWNGTDKPPQAIGQTLDGDKVAIRTIQTPAGHIIRLTDKAGEEKIEIIDAKGINQITIDGAGESIIMESKGDFVLQAKGNVTINADGNVELKSGGTTAVKATGAANLESSAAMTVKGSTVAIN